MPKNVCHWCLCKVKTIKDTKKSKKKVFCSVSCRQLEHMFQQWQKTAIELRFRDIGREMR